MGREAMKRLGDWMKANLDLTVGLDAFPEDFQVPADCGLAEMRRVCMECSTTFMASISGRILSCGNTCQDVAEVTYNNSAKALFRSVIESMITTRYILDGSNGKEKIGRVLREECNNLRGALRMQERNTLDQWGNRSIAETRSIVLQIETHHSVHFHSVIKNEMNTESKFASVVKRLKELNRKSETKHWNSGYDLYQEMSPFVHGSRGTLHDYGALYAGFLWVAYAFTENMSDYRGFLGLDPRKSELTQESWEMMDTWPRP